MSAYLIIAFLFPILSLPFSLDSIRKDFGNWKIYIFLLSSFLAALAYGYTPVNNRPDLVSYFSMAEVLGEMPFLDAVSSSIKGEEYLYLLNILLWIGGKFDLHLIPAISVFLVYYICFYITCDFAISEGFESKCVFAYIVFCIVTINYYGIVNNVRNILAFCLVGLAVYRDLYKNKLDIGTILLYLLPITLHRSAIIFLLLRFIILIPGIYKFFLIFIAVEVLPLTAFLYSHINVFSNSNWLTSIIRTIIYKSYWFYRNYESSWAITVSQSGSQSLSKIVYIFLAVVDCIVISMIQKTELSNKETETLSNTKGLSKYGDFCFCVGIVTIACAPMPMPEYWRFVSALIALSGPLLLFAIREKKQLYSQFYKLTYLVSPVALVLWVRELIRCDYGELIIGVLFMNPLFIVFKDIVDFILG